MNEKKEKELLGAHTPEELARKLVDLECAYDELASRMRNLNGWVTHAEKSYGDGWHIPAYQLRLRTKESGCDFSEYYLTKDLMMTAIIEIKEKNTSDILSSECIFVNLPNNER